MGSDKNIIELAEELAKTSSPKERNRAIAKWLLYRPGVNLLPTGGIVLYGGSGDESGYVCSAVLCRFCLMPHQIGLITSVDRFEESGIADEIATIEEAIEKDASYQKSAVGWSCPDCSGEEPEEVSSGAKNDSAVKPN